MKSPLVSVIVPTKNSSRTLEACLRSIKDQTYSSIEIIVVDNFSSDSTPDIARRFTKKFYSKGPERSYQRNFAVEKATGEYVFIIDSDMKLEPNVVEECVQQMSVQGTVGVTVPEISFGEGFWAQCKRLERSFYVGVPYMEAARFFRLADFVTAEGYDVSMVSGEDWDLSQRIAAKGTLAHASSFIHHDEGKISLLTTIKKKLYYAKLFASYKDAANDRKNVAKQTNLIGRYWLFLSQPKKLFRNPLLGMGMLFMKTCEFFFGGLGFLAGQLFGRRR